MPFPCLTYGNALQLKVVIGIEQASYKTKAYKVIILIEKCQMSNIITSDIGLVFAFFIGENILINILPPL